MDAKVNLLQVFLKREFSSAGEGNLFSFFAVNFYSPLQMFMSLGMNIEWTICVIEFRVSHQKNSFERKKNKYLIGLTMKNK